MSPALLRAKFDTNSATDPSFFDYILVDRQVGIYEHENVKLISSIIDEKDWNDIFP